MTVWTSEREGVAGRRQPCCWGAPPPEAPTQTLRLWSWLLCAAPLPAPAGPGGPALPHWPAHPTLPVPLTSSRARMRSQGGVLRRPPPPAARNRRSAPSEKQTQEWASCSHSSTKRAKEKRRAYFHLPVVLGQAAPRYRDAAARDRRELLTQKTPLLPCGLPLVAPRLLPGLGAALRPHGPGLRGALELH